jgi:hypothetical protein
LGRVGVAGRANAAPDRGPWSGLKDFLKDDEGKMMIKPTMKAAFAFSVLVLLAPVGAIAQDKEPKLVSCAELMAMDEAAQKAFLDALVAASADALDLNDLVTQGTVIGPIMEVCKGNPEMMAMDAAMSLQK